MYLNSLVVALASYPFMCAKKELQFCDRKDKNMYKFQPTVLFILTFIYTGYCVKMKLLRGYLYFWEM